MQQVQRIITVVDEAVAFNHSFIGSLRLDTFHPESPQAEQHSNVIEPGADVFHALGLDTFVLSILGRDVSPGVTKAQFQHVMRRCSECGHFCYKERQAAHRCPAGVSWAFKGGPEDLVAFLLSRTPNTGLSSMDMRRHFPDGPFLVTDRCPILGRVPGEGSSATMEVLPLKDTESTDAVGGEGHGGAGEPMASFQSKYLEWLSVQQQRSISTILDEALPFHPKAVPLQFSLDTFHPDAPRRELYTVNPTPDVLASLGRDFYILSTLGRDVSPGITNSEFEYLMSRCALCTRLCYKERQAAHRCPTTRRSILWKGGSEDLAAYLLSRFPNGGLSNVDISRHLGIHLPSANQPAPAFSFRLAFRVCYRPSSYLQDTSASQNGCRSAFQIPRDVSRSIIHDRLHRQVDGEFCFEVLIPSKCTQPRPTSQTSQSGRQLLAQGAWKGLSMRARRNHDEALGSGPNSLVRVAMRSNGLLPVILGSRLSRGAYWTRDGVGGDEAEGVEAKKEIPPLTRFLFSDYNRRLPSASTRLRSVERKWASGPVTRDLGHSQILSALTTSL
ncbi:hypothetical protein NMY22_g3914 [Coprinellus aureogranulatus]|nr:hypothetical protein NMY22_g3914 [Coprinellus aureogranulatus]